MRKQPAGMAARVFIFFGCLLCATQGQLPVPLPNPEFRKLQVLVGQWTYTGEYKTGPWGPGGKITGEYTFRFILNGFVLEARVTERNARGETHFLEIDTYNAAKSSISFTEYSDVDTSYSGVVNISGSTITRNGTVTAAGRQFAVRETLILSGDRTGATVNGELLSEGKMWLPYFQAKLTKMKEK
jgi:hypothetical protein